MLISFRTNIEPAYITAANELRSRKEDRARTYLARTYPARSHTLNRVCVNERVPLPKKNVVQKPSLSTGALLKKKKAANEIIMRQP